MGYLATTTLLKVLVVDMTNELLQSAVLEGVSRNTSIETLTIGKFIGHDRSTAAVAGVIRNNQLLRKLSISTRDCSEPGIHTVYGCWLLPLIENETLEEVSLPLLILHPLQWAAFFHALRTKEKLKNVHIEVPGDHRELLPLVAELVKIDKAQLAGLIRDRLRRTQTLDEFMRFAAVVKERVVCQPSDDGCTRLDALNEDCWRHVRQFLVLDDVKQDVE
ncbi:hypothetical protein HPB51_020027 [Rhipicephalus microplus]|uniref:Uncharacterized protein n=1 Tax=Rhipicephalus microplus TaxID=6941 RepID=A0A9J6EAX6_RHIMP|nr:hypothetical protein HPB51_020027 [Rhipicephalus microplus]